MSPLTSISSVMVARLFALDLSGVSRPRWLRCLRRRKLTTNSGPTLATIGRNSTMNPLGALCPAALRMQQVRLGASASSRQTGRKKRGPAAIQNCMTAWRFSPWFCKWICMIRLALPAARLLRQPGFQRFPPFVFSSRLDQKTARRPPTRFLPLPPALRRCPLPPVCGALKNYQPRGRVVPCCADPCWFCRQARQPKSSYQVVFEVALVDGPEYYDVRPARTCRQHADGAVPCCFLPTAACLRSDVAVVFPRNWAAR